MNDPTTSTPDDQLDRLLQTWAHEKQPTAEHLNSLCQRVQASLGEASDRDLSSPIVSPMANATSHSWIRMIVPVLSVAAGLVLCFYVWLQLEQIDSAGSLASKSSNGNSQAATADFTNQKQLMAKLQAVYDEPLVWIAETGDALQVELDDSADQAAKNSTQPWLLIRLAVERQELSTTENPTLDKPLWQIDLAVRNEHTVRLSGPSNASDQLQVWPCLTEDGLVMVDTQFDSLGPVKTKSNQTNLMRPGSRTRLSSLNDEYALWQYVEVVQANGFKS